MVQGSHGGYKFASGAEWHQQLWLNTSLRMDAVGIAKMKNVSDPENAHFCQHLAVANRWGQIIPIIRCLDGDRSARNVRAKRILPLVPSQAPTLPRTSSSMRVYVISDLHTDYLENLQWVKRLAINVFKQDVLIVAGDVAEKLETFEATMAILKDRFRHVFFVPGNHDLWCRDIASENVKGRLLCAL